MNRVTKREWGSMNNKTNWSVEVTNEDGKLLYANGVLHGRGVIVAPLVTIKKQ